MHTLSVLYGGLIGGKGLKNSLQGLVINYDFITCD